MLVILLRRAKGTFSSTASPLGTEFQDGGRASDDAITTAGARHRDPRADTAADWRPLVCSGAVVDWSKFPLRGLLGPRLPQVRGFLPLARNPRPMATLPLPAALAVATQPPAILGTPRLIFWVGIVLYW